MMSSEVSVVRHVDDVLAVAVVPEWSRDPSPDGCDGLTLGVGVPSGRS